MCDYRIEPKFEFLATLSEYQNPMRGKIFASEKEAKKALAKLPDGYEIVGLTRSGQAI
jgi:hypothetical protein